MKKYYTRACNFYYGSSSKKLINNKLALPLCADENIAFDKIKQILIDICNIKIKNRKMSIYQAKNILSYLFTLSNKNIIFTNMLIKNKLKGLLLYLEGLVRGQ